MVADWRALSGRQPASFDRRWFEVVNRSRAGAIEAIRSGIPDVRPRPWHEDRSGLETIFGPAAATHCFDEPPHSWAHLLEPQITRGFAHVLRNRIAQPLGLPETVLVPLVRHIAA